MPVDSGKVQPLVQNEASATATPIGAAHPADSYRAIAVAAGELRTDGFLEEAVRHLGHLSGAAHCAILVVEDGRLRTGAAIGLSDAYTAAVDGLVVSPEAAAGGAAAATGQPSVTPDIRTAAGWAAFRDVADDAGLRSCWSVPVSLPDGRVIGALAGYATTPGEPAAGVLVAVEEYAPVVALCLESLRCQDELERSHAAIVAALGSALDCRDEYTAAHSSKTADLAQRVGARLGLSAGSLRTLSRAAQLHDIGKLGIPTEILSKAAPLTPQEWEVMRRHSVIGERILARVPFLEDVAKAVRHEHERWDGAGYPDGLSGARIPMASRIVFVCDSYHAMTSFRPYRPAMDPAVARAELRKQAGSQFDPAVVSALLVELDTESSEPLFPGHLVRAQARGHALGAIAEQVGATDVFVFRPSAGAHWAHLDGVGCGARWAGNVELREEHEPHLREVLKNGGLLLLDRPEPIRVLGPYYARGAALVRAPHGEVVVFGALSQALSDVDEERLGLLAERAARAVADVPPAKRLEDELEVLDAVRAVTTVSAEALPAALGDVASCAAAALSCEFAAVATLAEPGGKPVIGWAGPGWSPVRESSIRAAMIQLAGRLEELPLVVQDSAGAPFELTGFRLGDGITSWQALPVGGEAVAILLLAHASTAPRGFTTLCRRVAGAVADAAESVVRRAVAQERLSAENAELSERVATDALTGVASRSWWEERLARHLDAEDATERSWSVVVVDLDGLKELNDSQGHRVGDELLRACARVLQRNCRDGDRVARIGGDEFAVLLQDAAPAVAQAWCERLHAAAAEHERLIPELPMSFSTGWGSTSPDTGLYAALAQADERMYESKRGRRSGRAV